jgi:hypothetical protein
MKTLMITALTAAAGIAHAGDNTVTQTLNYSWNQDNGFEIGTLDAFDTAGGTRELIGVSFEIAGSLSMSIEALNFSDFALESGEWSAEGNTNVNVLFGDFGPGSVERIVGGLSFNGLTGELGAGSGSPFGNPGTPTVTDSLLGALSGSFTLNSSDFGVFTAGPVSTNLLSFSDFLISDALPGSIISVGSTSLESEGAISLTYTFNNVPAPSAAGVLGLAGLLGARRRR